MGDLKDMDINQLIAAYCALKYDNVKKQALIADVIAIVTCVMCDEVVHMITIPMDG